MDQEKVRKLLYPSPQDILDRVAVMSPWEAQSTTISLSDAAAHIEATRECILDYLRQRAKDFAKMNNPTGTTFAAIFEGEIAAIESLSLSIATPWGNGQDEDTSHSF